jgi:hypothetical protein
MNRLYGLFDQNEVEFKTFERLSWDEVQHRNQQLEADGVPQRWMRIFDPELRKYA